MANEVRIIVRTQNDAKAGFDAANKQTEDFAEQASTTFRERFAQRMSELGARLAAPLQQAGQDIGQRLGDNANQSFGQRMRERIRSLSRDVDASAQEAGNRIGQRIGDAAGERISRSVDRSVRGGGGRQDNRAGSGGIPGGDDPGNMFTRLVRRAIGAGRDAAGKFSDGFVGGMQAGSQTIIGQIATVLMVGVGAIVGPAILSIVSSAITSGIMLALGGGVLAAGIASAFKDPMVAGAAKDLKTLLGGIFTDFGKPFRGPILDVMESFARFLTQMRPQFQEIAEIFAPLTRQLGQGIIGALQNAMPGILEAVKASAPFIEILADRAPEIGQAIGDFFRKIADQGDDAAIFFNDLITVIIKVIGWVGDLISAFTSWYNRIRNLVTNTHTLFLMFLGWIVGIFGRILDAAYTAFSWIPGLGAKVATARNAFTQLRVGVNRELNQIKDKTVTIRMRTVGLQVAQTAANVARQLSQMGYAHGGIRGAQDGATSNGMTWVGEAGPELVSLPPGTRVHTAGDSKRMAGAGGGMSGGEVLVRLHADRTTERGLFEMLWSMLQAEVVTKGGGSVQVALGRGPA